MKHVVAKFILCFPLVWLIAACSNRPTPTQPSPIASLLDAPLMQSAAPRIVDWSTFTARAGVDQPPAMSPDAPAAPSNLAFQVSSSTVILTWSPPGGGGAVVSYVLEAGTGAGLNNVASFNTGSMATTFTATGVPNGSYFVRVRARNADGTSGPSNEVVITVGGGGGPCPTPGAPAGFAASASGNTVTLTWNTVAGALSFIIEAGSAPGATNIIAFDTASTATAFTGNAPDGTYYLRVRVRTACGLSAASNEVVLTVGGSAPPPGGNLSGLWQGTVVIREPSRTTTQQMQIEFTHSGTRLTGVVRSPIRSSGQATFDLNQTQSNPPTFEGIVFVPGDTAGCETKRGALTAQTSTRLTGRFTETAPCGIPHTVDFDLTKVPGS